jgi:hypothetical protein
MALEGIGSTPAFGAVVRKPQIRCGPGTGLDFVPPLSPLSSVQMPSEGEEVGSSNANQTTLPTGNLAEYPFKKVP